MVTAIKQYLFQCFQKFTPVKFLLSVFLLLYSVIAGLIFQNLFVFLSIYVIMMFWVLWFYLLGPLGKTPGTHLIKRCFHILPLFSLFFIQHNSHVEFPSVINPIFNLLLGIAIFVVYGIYNYQSIFFSASTELLRRDQKVPFISTVLITVTALTLAIGEEIFFRGFILVITYPFLGFLAPLFSVVYFIIWHFLGKWGENFDTEDYIIQGLFGILSGYLMILSHGLLLGSILSHVLINSTPIFISIKKYLINRKNPSHDIASQKGAFGY